MNVPIMFQIIKEEQLFLSFTPSYPISLYQLKIIRSDFSSIPIAVQCKNQEDYENVYISSCFSNHHTI